MALPNFAADTLGVLYSCHACGFKDIEVRVRYRHPTEDVVKWVEHVGECLARDHRRRAPGCPADEAKDVKIPMGAGNDFIGGPSVQ